MKITLIDTDVGDDIDDALALTYALKSQQLDLIGVTTVYKNTALRARQAKKLLHLCGADEIPVYAGWGSPLVNKCNTDEIFCQYTDDLSDEKYDYENMEDGKEGIGAVDFIIESANKYGNELTVLLIGPYTNIAKAIEKDIEAVRKIGRIVIMGGSYFDHFIEWNVMCDPEAAKILIESGLPLYCVGHEVTERCIVTESELKTMLCAEGDELRKYLAHIVRLWTNTSKRNPILHDPLAVNAVISSDFLKYVDKIIKVELDGVFTRGMTLDFDHCSRFKRTPPEGHRVSVAVDVDVAGFKKHFFDTVYY